MHSYPIEFPYREETEVGFRPLPYEDIDSMTELFRHVQRQLIRSGSLNDQKLDTAQYDRSMTLIELANDEGDFGTTLLLSHHLLQYPLLSSEFRRIALISYRLLQRPLLSKLADLHHQARWRRQLSMLPAQQSPIVSGAVEVISSESRYQAALADFRAYQGRFFTQSLSLSLPPSRFLQPSSLILLVIGLRDQSIEFVIERCLEEFAAPPVKEQRKRKTEDHEVIEIDGDDAESSSKKVTEKKRAKLDIKK